MSRIHFTLILSILLVHNFLIAEDDLEVSETVMLPIAHSIGWVKQQAFSGSSTAESKWDGVLDEKKWGTPSPKQMVSRNWDWGVTDAKWDAWVKEKSPTESEETKFDLWIPGGTGKVAGVVAISGHGSGEYLYRHPELRELARELNLAIFKFVGNPVQRGFWPHRLMYEKLGELGEKLKHAEVAKAPLFLYGHSNGTGFSALFAASQPDRVWGWISMRPGITFQVFQPGAAKVPGFVIFGEDDHFLARPSREENLAVVPYLRKNHAAVWCQAIEPKTGHGPGTKTWPLVMSFLKYTFQARVVDGEENLAELKLENGFLGENWISEKGGYQDLKIALYKEFSGEKEAASWLLNEAFAKDWQSFQKFGEVK